ncbi:hypothetical protein [Legionella feeleii]|uniref:Uncharacterized protein n=1 Tax=Legionella feeleii TaxID=453 RepID=A0A0W0THB6_9GAMM|nr:hypothetical protein [Legionella feeleii]KTC94923.1 hypothetical protein Lfee_2587 [Legionella feeleii]SPX62014.1 Uncharacterised protein [Legionella feeleii]
MVKTKISPQKYVELINQEIKKMDGFIEGMVVYLVPSTDNPTGYSFDRQFEGIEQLVSTATHRIKKDYICQCRYLS